MRGQKCFCIARSSDVWIIPNVILCFSQKFPFQLFQIFISTEVCHSEYLFAYQSSIIHSNSGQHVIGSKPCCWVCSMFFSPLTLFFFPFSLLFWKQTHPPWNPRGIISLNFEMVHKEIYIYIHINISCQQYVGVHFPMILVGSCSSIIT